MNTWLFLSKLMGIARRGVLKELEVCDFEKKIGEHVNEMMAVAVKNFKNFLWPRFLIIRQNVNMATNAILYSGLTPIEGSQNTSLQTVWQLPLTGVR